MSVIDLEADVRLQQDRPYVIYASDYLFIFSRVLLDRFCNAINRVSTLSLESFPKRTAFRHEDGTFGIIGMWASDLAKLGTSNGLYYMVGLLHAALQTIV